MGAPAVPTTTVDNRYCPLCDQSMAERICPRDGIETLPVATLGLDTSLEPLTVVGGRYRIEALLGRGAMGAVYRATQLSMQRTVALKVLLGEGLKEPSELRRFYREAHAASRLDHPNVVKVYDFGFDGDSRRPYIAMELVRGEPLRATIEAEAPMPSPRAGELVGQIGRALVSAHAAGVVHRDLKPDNVMVRRLPDGEPHVTVLDFGIAKAIGGQGSGETSTGGIVGTPRYMSPEQARGDPVSPAADLYALGCILFECLTGKPPFEGRDPVETMIAHVSAPPPELGPSFSPELRGLVAALLAKTPEARPADTGKVVAALRSLKTGSAWPEGLLPEPAPEGAECEATVRPGAKPAAGVGPSSSSTAEQEDKRARPLDAGLEASAATDPGDGGLTDAPAPEPSATGRRRLAIMLGVIAAAAMVWSSLGPAGEDPVAGPGRARPGPAGATAGEVHAPDEGTGHEAARPGDGAAARAGPARAPESPGAGSPTSSPQAGEAPARGVATPVAPRGGDAAPGAATAGRAAARAARTRSVTVTSEPPGAEVWVAGRRRGRTPLAVRVPRRGLVVELRAPGHEPTRRRIEGAEAGPVAVDLAPELAPR